MSDPRHAPRARRVAPGLALAAALLAAGAAPLAAQGTAPSTAPNTAAAPAARPAERAPASILFIGNSFFYYNNGISNLLSGLRAAGPQPVPLRATMATIGGSGFDWHDVESLFRPNAVGRYSIGADNVVRFNDASPLFEVAVLMDCSQCPVHPDLSGIFTDYARRHTDTVRRHGARPVLFMSWAYQDKPEMTGQLAEAYDRAGRDNDAAVIPAGLAFARVVRSNPEINLYIADKRHPTLAGSYLAAATTYAALFNQSPVGSAFTGGLDPAQARILQQAAWDTVQERARR